MRNPIEGCFTRQTEDSISYVFEGLLPETFAALFELPDRTLAERNIVAVTADSDVFPCCVTLRHAVRDDQTSVASIATRFRRSCCVVLCRYVPSMQST